MTETVIVLIVIFGIIAAASFILKNDEAKIAPVIFIAALIGALVAGMGLRIREVIEGPFAYIDIVLAVITGMIFVTMLMDNGTLKLLFNKIIYKKRSPIIQSLLLMLLVALPGVFTGTATACILTTGAMVGEYLIRKGIENSKVVEFVAFSSLLGILMPPICFPAMIIAVSRAGSYPGSFEGFTIPLAIATIPALLIYASMSAKKIGSLEEKKVEENIKLGRASIPLIVVAILLISHNFLYKFIPFLGYPLIFTIGAILAALLPVEKVNIIKSSGKGISLIAPYVAVAFSTASVLEVLALTGVSGNLATMLYTVNPILLTIVAMIIVIIVGILGGKSLATVVGVIFSYIMGAILEGNNVMLLIALSIALCLGGFMPIRGGIIEKVKTILNVKDVDTKEVLKSVAISMVLIFLVGIIYVIAYKSLVFLIV